MKKVSRNLFYLKGITLVVFLAIALVLIAVPAQATVTILDGWTNKINNTNASPQSFSYTTSAGSNRLLLVAITTKYGSAATQTYSAAYGGKSLTMIAQYNTGRDNTWVGYLKEADIVSRSSNTIQVTYTGGPSNTKVFVASYQNVDQSLPITDANGIGNNNTTNTSISFGRNITIAAGDQLFYVVHSGSGTASHTPPTGYTELLEHTGNGLSVSVGHRNSTLAGSENQTISFSASSRVSLVVASLNDAATTTCTASAPTVTISPAAQTITTNGVSVSYTVNVKNNDAGSGCTSTSFKLALTDSDSTGMNFVVPSVLSSGSVTVAPGANTNVTMTVRAKTGATTGTNNVSVTATATGHTNATSNTVATTINIPPLTITTASLQGGTQNVSYSTALAASGGTTPYTWSKTSGSLPNGLTLNSATGVISGTPTTAGSFSFSVQVTDSSNSKQTSAKTLSITILPGSQLAPILIISSNANPFSGYYAEILRAEGFNEFAVSDISSVSSTVLNAYDVVLLGDMALTSGQVTMLTNWVNAGGHLIAMHPDKQLAGLLGLTDQSSTMANAYLLVNTSTGPGVGIVSQTIQYHGTADLYRLGTASNLATLYSNATTSTSYAAVSLNSVGTNGGQAAAFVYDLARSIVYTRQGNPAWAGQARDSLSPNRSDDLFYGAASFDPQPDWVDLNKVAIPQADEQQRLLANLIIQMNLNKKPLPRFWYFPRSLEAVVVMTGDDHGSFYSGGATAARFDQYLAASPPGCVVDNWECVRSSAYIFPPSIASNPLTNSQAAAYISGGFEIGVHVDSNSDCSDWTPASLEAAYTSDLNSFASMYTSVPAPVTHRMHCISWSDYDSQPKTELGHGIRLDTNYYYYPPNWANDRPGLFTGSGMPMRFADINGNMLDIYQATTQMTDESGQTYPYTIDTLLDNATGPAGYYGAYVANMHNDVAQSYGADAIVASAQARGIPVVSARQMLTWLDSRNASKFSYLSWSGNTLSFSINVGQGASKLVAMAPVANGQTISSIISGGATIPFTMSTIKGVQYALFFAANGTYQVSYATDITPPTVTSVSPVNGSSGVGTVTNVTAVFSEAMDPATISVGTFELRDPANTLVSTTVTYNAAAQTATLFPIGPLANSTTYTATIKGGTNGVKDLVGNPLTNSFTWSFTTAAVSVGVYSIWPNTTIPGVVDSGPDSAVELGVKFRADVSGYVSGIRFYKASANIGTHIGNLWTSNGTLLSKATFTNETASGWQQVSISPPVAVTANTVYVASYHTTVGHYSADGNYFSGKGVDSPPLHALADGVASFDGVYVYGSTSSFPSQGWNSSNYWIDVVFSTSVQPDTAPPIVTAFTIPATATALTVTINSFTATDNVGVTGYMVNELSTAPSATAIGWSSTVPASYTFATAGNKTLYAWAKDAAGNVSASKNASVIITLSSDTVKPTVTAFTIPVTAASLTESISSFTATDNVGVTGYMVNELSTAPSATAVGWSSTAPASYTFATAGSKTLYAWAKDAAGNVSASRSANVTITIQTTGVEPTGWYAGDIHVHRSCGGSPETVSAMFQKMSSQNLTFMSLLADMGDGEVQNPVTDLPLVTGQDASISTPSQILHWDAEWHWDPSGVTYPQKALGGHVVALGLTNAHQIWEEYTYPIFTWAHQQNGIAGFAHMQYLDNNIPTSLSCCTPIEYPVEVALGSADFISEDDFGGESFIQAYYRLLNTGFRPGFAAGTDYPCNNPEVGNLLTYVQVAGGQMTYNNWVQGIAKGRTVISRNGHNEFLSLTVNNSATPGDEIKLTGAGSVPVTITWTANQSLSGTIELVQNSVVVASQQASVASGAPASLTTTVGFANSGWLVARRMDSNGHVVHTGAVFVTVNNLPVRASVDDANFYVQWMDNLLTNTSPGGAWSSYFPTNLKAAQARYSAAKALFQQIALEAGGQPTTLNITTTSLSSGGLAISYSASLAAGGGASPYTWSISSGLLPAGLTLNSLTGVISGSPTATGTYSFTVQATDSSNPVQTATKDLSITITAQATFTIWPNSTTPAVVDDGPDSAVELGVKFRSDSSGYITGIRFYKASTNTGTHVANLWTSTGTQLATATFANETASGWQQVNFTTPVAITANTVYVASYHTNVGHYSDDQSYFAGKGVDNPPLHALADGVSGLNGVYAYGSASSLPNQGWNSSNYWVDVVFQP